MKRVAIVLVNLGGPDSPAAVLPFLRNLFRDPAILQGLPGLVRWPLAEWIARRRASEARAIYSQLGGGSPIRQNCEAQAAALTKVMSNTGEFRTFVAMRCWHPRASETAAAIAAFNPDSTIFLPLYPQFSTTTTGSSLKDWCKFSGAPDVAIGCYPELSGYIRASVGKILPFWNEAQAVGTPRLLFSAHGLPKRISEAGDPYSKQIRLTATAIAKELGLMQEDWRICFQSRVGRLEWLGPEIDEEIQKAGAEGVPVVVVPIAFTSEHSETLVELDIKYVEIAREYNVPGYFRVPTVATDAAFIEGLAILVGQALAGLLPRCPRDQRLICPAQACG